ncbi:MAG: signal peptidase I [Bacillota bacterium]
MVQKMDKVKRFIREMIFTIIIAGLITFIIKFYFLDNRIIPTSSMYPTIYAGDMVFVNKLVYRFSVPQRGDIIVFEPHEEVSKDDLIKRIIALPGETVEIKDHQVFINGEAIEEPYLNEAPQYDFGPVEVPKEHLFVLGDNRNMSFDSHRWPDPFLEISSVKGKAFFRYWPLKRIGRLKS